MTISEVLREDREHLPEWLSLHASGRMFDRSAFFGSQVVYYPGAGYDGQPVKLFGSAHASHAFVYADRAYTEDEIRRRLEPNHPGHFTGYHVAVTERISERQLIPNHWQPSANRPTNRPSQYPSLALSWAELAVLDRDDDRDDEHGVRRLAVLFMKCDGFAAYDALFCQGAGTPVPFGVLLQDYGFGGNYDRFGGGGLLEQITRAANAFPPYLLIGDNTTPWQGYGPITDVPPETGGTPSHARSLYRRD